MPGQLAYLTGDATRPIGQGAKIIVHVCNDVGGWGKGFVLAISKRWPKPEASYRAWHKGRGSNDFGLGAVQHVEVENDLWVANLIGQRDVRVKDGIPPVRYDAIAAGLEKVAVFARQHQASVHMPRIGCGLAGGKWEQMEAVIKRALVDQGIDVTVYDLA